MQLLFHRVLSPTCLKYRYFSARPPLKRLPAGNSNIASFLNPRLNMFYVDKAAFIPAVENAAMVTVLLRPKRWGKSVFLNLLASYYDVAHAAAPLVRLPAGDTPLAHSFTILKLDVANVARALSSAVTANDMQKQTNAALDAEVYTAVRRAVYRYNIPGVDMTLSPTDLLTYVGGWAQLRGYPLYILIDEYDAVLRSLAISSGSHAIATLAGRQGPLHEFFGRFKYLLDSGLASHVFMTGISAVGLETMATVTIDLSQKPAFNSAVGFTRDDTLRAIAECLGYLFATKLHATDGMYQSVMVVQLLDAILAQCDTSLISLTRFLEQWIPSYSVAAEPDRELMDYFAPSAAMVTLLPKLVSGRPLTVPSPLAALSVMQQVAAAIPPAAAVNRTSSATASKALAAASFDALTPIDLTETEGTVVRTLFYEGLLTHMPGQVDGLRVSNDFMQQHFISKLAQHLAADTTLLRAAEGFILRGKTKALETALEASCAPGLIWQGVFKWHEFDCSQRLQLLLSIASQSTHFRWALEESAHRVRSDGSATPGRTDVSGLHSSGRRVIHIEVKQVHLVWDLEAFTATIGGFFNASSTPHRKALLDFAKRLRHIKVDELLALKLHEKSIKRNENVDTAGDVLDGAMEQARDYARGWMQSRASEGPLPQLELYAAVRFGPLRWVIVPVSLDSEPVCCAASAGSASTTTVQY